MPLNGFQRDENATKAARAKGLLICPDSYITKAKLIPGENTEPEPHIILKGADKAKARMFLFERERSRCQNCGVKVLWDDSILPVQGEWSHIRDKAGQKCDCPANAMLLCHNCHQGPGSEHYKRRPRFGPAA